MAVTQPQTIVVIGAGIVGAATAYFLGRAGHRVRLIDAASPAAAASGAADGAVSVASKRAGPMMMAALAGVRLYGALERDGLFAGLFKSRPTYILAQSEEEEAVLERHAGALAEAGVRVELMGGAAMREQVPVLSASVRAAAEVHGEGHAIGYQIVHRLVAASGATVARNCRVDGLVFEGSGKCVSGVSTSRGVVVADGVVIAAGGGSAMLLGLEGVLRPRKGQLLVTERGPELNAALPGSMMSCRYLLSKSATGDGAGPVGRGYGLVIDPLGTGQFLIGSTREDTGDGSGNDMEAVARILRDAVGLLPGLAGLRLLRAFAGVRTATADGLPLVGRAPGIANLVIATGFEGDGICLGPLVGKLVGQLVAGGTTDIDLAPFDPGRFDIRSAAA